MLLHIQLWHFFFPQISCWRQVQLLCYLIFGYATLLCGEFLFIKLSEGPVQLSDCTINTPPRSSPTYLFGWPVIRPWYYLQRRISAGAKFHPSPHLKLPQRRGGGKLARDPRMQTAAWMGLVVNALVTLPLWLCWYTTYCFLIFPSSFQLLLCRCWTREWWPQRTTNKAFSKTTGSLRCWNTLWETIPCSAASRKMPTRWRFCSSFSSVDRMTYTAAHKTLSSAFEYVLFSFELIPGVGSCPLIDMTMPQAVQPRSQSSTFFIDCFGAPSHKNK